MAYQASREIGMKIKGILKSCFWILLHQGTLSLICFRIQGYMLYLTNEVEPCVTSAVGFVWDAKPVFPTVFIPWLENHKTLALLRLLEQTGKLNQNKILTQWVQINDSWPIKMELRF